MKKPSAFALEPPTGPVIHARPVRAPGARDPRWYWRCTVYQGGEERCVWTGRGSTDDVKAAIWQLVGRGDHLAPSATQEVVVRTVGDLLALWRGHLAEQRQDLAPGTRESYADHSRALEDVIGHVLLDQLGAHHLEQYRGIVLRPPPVGARRRKARSPSTLKLDMLSMRMAWNWGRSIGATPDRPLASIVIHDRERGDDRYTPSAQEVADLIASLPVPWMRDVLSAQWATGCRIGELGAALVGDVDMERKQLVVGIHERARKTGRRLVPLPDEAIPLFKRLVDGRAASEALFARSCKGANDAINRAINKALAQVAWSTHAIRRAYVVRAVRAGVDVATVASITGHSVGELLRTYRTVFDEDRRAAAAKIGGALPEAKPALRVV